MSLASCDGSAFGDRLAAPCLRDLSRREAEAPSEQSLGIDGADLSRAMLNHQHRERADQAGETRMAHG